MKGESAYDNLVRDDEARRSDLDTRYDHRAAHYPDDEELSNGSDAATTTGIKTAVTSVPVDHVGTTVYLKSWRPEGVARYPLLIVHDLGEQTELYRECALDYVHEGYSVHVFDLRGHGRSGRRLGHAPSFNVLVKDLLQVAAWVKHREGGRAPIILGHGIGALIMMDFAKSFGPYCKASILSAPVVELATKIKLPTRIVIKVLADLSPNLRLPSALTPRFARTLKDDGTYSKLSYFPRLSAVFAHELLMAIERAEARFIDYPGSVLILCPGQDTICSYARIKQAAAVHTADNVRIVDLEGIGHHVFTEDAGARRATSEVILPWLGQVLSNTES